MIIVALVGIKIKKKALFSFSYFLYLTLFGTEIWYDLKNL